MVVFSIKINNEDGFLYETTTDTPNFTLISSLVQIYNARLQAGVTAECARDLVAHGPMKPPQTVNDPIESTIKDPNISCSYDADEPGVISPSSSSSPDPTNNRNGNPPDPNYAKIILETVQDLEGYISKAQVKRRITLEEAIIAEKMQNLKGAIMMAYPMGLPDWDTLKINLESSKNIQGILQPEKTSLWVAGKEFPRGKLVSDRLGKNEKQKVIAKIQPSDDGPPSREPVVSELERKAMMAHYFKRQEELKKLNEADDDDYLNSSWADPKEMKRGLQGLGTVRAPGLRF